MLLDAATLLIASVCTTFVQGLLLVFFWIQDRKAKALGIWGMAFMVGGIGLGLFAGRGSISDLLSVMLSNALVLLAFAGGWAGARIFGGRQVSVLAVLAAPVLWMVSCLDERILELQPMRTAVVSLMIALLSGAAAVEFWRDRDERLASRRPLFLLFAALSIIFTVRTAYGNLLPYPIGGEAPAGNGWYAGFAFFIFVTISVMAFLFVALSKERVELSQRQNVTVDPVTGVLRRGAFMLQAARIVARFATERRPVCLMLIDLETTDDTVGDTLLQRFADRTLALLKPSDLTSRMGRKEFACVLSNVSHNDAILLGETIQSMSSSDPAFAANFRVRIGMASSTQVGHDVRALVEAADAALEHGKRSGGNVVLFHPSLERTEELPSDTSGQVIPFSNRDQAWNR